MRFYIKKIIKSFTKKKNYSLKKIKGIKVCLNAIFKVKQKWVLQKNKSKQLIILNTTKLDFFFNLFFFDKKKLLLTLIKSLFFFFKKKQIISVYKNKKKVFKKLYIYVYGIFFLFKKYIICGIIRGSIKKPKMRNKVEIFMFKKVKIKKKKKTKAKKIKNFFFKECLVPLSVPFTGTSMLGDLFKQSGLIYTQAELIPDQWIRIKEEHVDRELLYNRKKLVGIYEFEEYELEFHHKKKRVIYAVDLIFLNENVKKNFKGFKYILTEPKVRRRRLNKKEKERNNLISLAIALYRFYKKYGKVKKE